MRDEKKRRSSSADPLPREGQGAASLAAGRGRGRESIVQARRSPGTGARGPGQVQRTAARGVAGSGGELPYRDTIERSFGAHAGTLAGVKAHTGGEASEAAEAIGAVAYASGNDIAFGRTPDLHTAAHEAAHVIHQSGGVQLKDGVGEHGDAYERHADAVADAVVRGDSAESLLDAGPAGASGQVQRKECGGCGACATCAASKAPAAPSASSPVVQRRTENEDAAATESSGDEGGFLDSAREAIGDAYDAVAEWIDLLGPKTELLGRITDGTWIIDAVSSAQGNEAHEKHRVWLNLELIGVGLAVGAEAMGMAMRIASCNDLEAVEALSEEFEQWKAERVATLEEELEAKLEEYRETERGWLTAFGSAGELERDPAHPNQTAQDVRLAFQPGVPQSTVTVETRVSCNFGRTAGAMADNDGDGDPDVADWTDEEKEHFMTRFQEQLDQVWSTGAGGVAPFRLTSPADGLLADESPKWSEVTATMQGRVTQSDASPHYTLTVQKEAPGEGNRAFVGSGGTGTFYLKNADAGLDADGNPTGAQMTLAHEWHHMIGNPDEYAESSQAQGRAASTPASRSGDWTACQQHFQDIVDDGDSTAEQVAAAQADLAGLRNHASDVDAAPGFQSGIFPLANRDDIPDECFAIRGTWDEGPSHRRLRPGARSQRGGTNISASAADAARLSDRGNQVRPYMREGIIEELRPLLEGAFDPEVSFDHNFQEMSTEDAVDTIQVRIQNMLHDQVSLGASSAPGDQVPDGHDHDHGDEGHEH